MQLFSRFQIRQGVQSQKSPTKPCASLNTLPFFYTSDNKSKNMVSTTMTSSQFFIAPSNSRFVHASYINSSSFCFKSKVVAKARSFCRCAEWKLATKNQTNWAESKWRHFLQFVSWHHKHCNESSQTHSEVRSVRMFPLENFLKLPYSRYRNEQTVTEAMLSSVLLN